MPWRACPCPVTGVVGWVRWQATHQGGHGEVTGVHLFRQPVHLPAGVYEDDGLRDCESLVEIAQRVQLPLLQRIRGETGKYYYIGLSTQEGQPRLTSSVPIA